MQTEMTQTEAAAVIALKSLISPKSQLGRVLAFSRLQGSPALDWLMERGYVTVRIGNPTVRGFLGEPMPYVTKTGKAWFHASPGPGVALLVVTKPWVAA